MPKSELWFCAQNIKDPTYCIANVGIPIFDDVKCTFTNSIHPKLWVGSPKADWDHLDTAMKGLLYKYFTLISAPYPPDFYMADMEGVEH